MESPASMERPPFLNDQRIVLLGRNYSENCSVGNIILGKAVFGSGFPPDEVHSAERQQIKVINVPHLLQTHLTENKIIETVKKCLHLSYPGPHVIVLVLKHEQCSTEFREHVEKVLNYFPNQMYNHTMVLTIEDPDSVEPTEDNDISKEIIKKCFNRHYQLKKSSSTADLREKLETFVQTNCGNYLVCDESYGSDDSEKTLKQQVAEGGQTELPLTVALFGNTASVQYSKDNILLGEKQLCFSTKETSVSVSVKRTIAEHRVNVINMTGLHDAELLHDYSSFIDQLVKENEIQAFIFVVRLGQLTDSDKTGLEWLQRVFGDKVLQFVIVLFTYETEEECVTIVDDLKKNPVLENLVQKCGGRYQTCNKKMNNQSEMIDLMRKIEDLFKENQQQSYTGEMFSTRVECKSDNEKDTDTTKKVNTISIKKVKQKDIRLADKTKSEDGKEKKMNEKTKHLFDRLHLKAIHQKLKAADVLQITARSLQPYESCGEDELVQTFLQKLLMMNYRARYISVKNDQHHRKDNDSNEDMSDIFKAMSISNKGTSESDQIHPMDVQMAVFHCSDGFLKQLMVTKLSQCQFSLPLLVPDPFTLNSKIEFPLWTFRQIHKSWKIRNTDNEFTSQTQPIYKTQTPMVFFFRFGSVSSSKSQLMNSLINEKHNTFFHRNCPGSSRTRVLMDGVVEIAWFCPSGTNDDKFNEIVAFCNLHGDAGEHEKQLQIISEMASVNLVLLSKLDKNDKSAKLIQNLYQNSKPLICLFTEDESSVTQLTKGKFKIGLKDKNQSAVSAELRKAISDCLKESSSTFRLEDMSKHLDVRVDEENEEDCRRGREAAQQMMSLLEKKKLTEIKESFLPHQGKLWHQWSQKNKELHRLRGDEIEMDIIRKKQEIKTIRQRQHETSISEFTTLFIKEMTSNEENKIYFLKWLGILLDEYMSADFSALLQKYNEMWATVLKLKENNEKPEQLTAEQTKLDSISEDLNFATFGVEHIMREIGQIYESCESVKENKKDLPVHFSSLPGLAAEMMISGFPLELMDGDAAHVPVIWISAVLDQLTQKLGDQTRVFVLSVLGLQSSGKSTMLNAMFGLQFAVSAGRCTRGAFMQLVKVSEEMKRLINFDYILVVDTEGLNALELAGRSTRNHDNELATFVVGLANLTIINIFGENPSEMQDILQIVVQAFLRMKKVRLNPSCVFVHQNVPDVTAGEKNMEGRRRLLEKLDEMTKVAAEEEVCDAECFSDVIEFDVRKDVKYFAHLWEGSPPMAPPNPNYCENVQKLKDTFMSQSSNSEIKLQYLKDRVKDLWEALLSERFVFSFRNSLEISAYRKLETEYSKWSWSLRSAMMDIENKLHNKIENEAINEVEEIALQKELKKTSEKVDKNVTDFFEKGTDANILIQWKTSFEIKIKDVQQNIVKETKMKLNEILQQRELKKKIDAQRTHRENTLFEKSKELALKLKHNANNDETLKLEFNYFWNQCINEIADTQTSTKNIDILADVKRLLGDIYQGHFSAEHWKEDTGYNDIVTVKPFSQYVIFKRSKKRESTDPLNDDSTSLKETTSGFAKTLYPEDEAKIRSLVTDVVQQTEKMTDSLNISKLGYNVSYIQQLTNYIKTTVAEHQKGQLKYVLKNEFFVDLVFSVCSRVSKTITDQHMMFRDSNDPVLYLERKRDEYYNIFRKYCQGAASAAIFGEIICLKLKEPIEQSVYKKTARDLADEMRSNCESLNGNRSNLEKHILKTLAEEEDFNKYMEYIDNPRDHFKSFIRDEVSRYITDQFSVSVLPKMKGNNELLQKKILKAAHESTEHVRVNSGHAGLWLKSFTQKLSEELIFSEKDFSGVKHEDVENFKLLEDVIRQELPTVLSDITCKFNTETFPVKLDCKFRPDTILIDHFCQCCWVQCPFCKAICTNTIEDHKGDHSVSFHRVIGLNGIYYQDTENLSSHICTSAVASSTLYFCPNESQKILWREYRTAGEDYAKWSITPDLSELPYWKWFVCRFQKDLETHYNKRFDGQGKIPDEWTTYSKPDAFESLDKYF